MPLQCEFFALEGISQLMRTIDMVKHRLNPGLALEGIVLTMVDRRNNLSEQVAADVRGHFGDQVFETSIPATSASPNPQPRPAGAASNDFRSAGAQAYLSLASEFLRRAKARVSTSFSEEKEAKRLFMLGLGRWLGHSPWPEDQKFFGSFFQKRTACLSD